MEDLEVLVLCIIVALCLCCKLFYDWVHSSPIPQQLRNRDNPYRFDTPLWSYQGVQSESYSSGVHDLHGMSVSDAIAWVQDVLRRSDRGDRVHFVTGRGLHSPDPFPAIKMAVERYLRTSGYRFWETARGGQVVVQL